LIVLTPRAASKATRALKSAVKFLRFFFFMVLGRNLPRTPQLSNLKSNQALGSIRRGHLSCRLAASTSPKPFQLSLEKTALWLRQLPTFLQYFDKHSGI
jgi:hypothetical protein